MWASDALKLAFKECVVQARGIDTKVSLKLDVPTRWNYNFIMLGSSLKYYFVFGSFTIRDRNYKYCSSSEEWKRAKKCVNF